MVRSYPFYAFLLWKNALLTGDDAGTARRSVLRGPAPYCRRPRPASPEPREGATTRKLEQFRLFAES